MQTMLGTTHTIDLGEGEGGKQVFMLAGGAGQPPPNKAKYIALGSAA